jgi:hypothetical protein
MQKKKNNDIMVLKASGEYEPYDEKKVRTSLRRAGAEEDIINKIIETLEPKLYDRIKTREIYDHIFLMLQKFRNIVAAKYQLKNAVMQLGPSGYPFEKFMAGILAETGYDVEVGRIIMGRCVQHEIDITALKKDEIAMIECKFHNRPGTKLDVAVMLGAYARFLDVKQTTFNFKGQQKHFNIGWAITNTKITTEVVKYADCVGMKIMSWDYPHDFCLRVLVEKTNLHPITVLTTLDLKTKRLLLNNGVIFCRDFSKKKIPYIPEDVLKKALEEAKKLCLSKKKTSTSQ